MAKSKRTFEQAQADYLDKKDQEQFAVGQVKGTAVTNLTEDQQDEIIKATMKELEKSEDALSEIIAEYPEVKRAYIDNEKRDDPYYVDYNLMFNNVDMLMALSYSNEMKAIFTGTGTADLQNADIITKTAEYEYREEMDMDLTEYEILMDKYIFGVGAVVRERDSKTNSAIPKCCPAEYFRPDPTGRGHADRYRYMGWYGKMTKQQMLDDEDFFNVDELVTTERNKESSDKNNNGSNVSIEDDDINDDSAYYTIFNQFRTKDDGTKCLVTLGNGGKTLLRYIELDYMIGKRHVFPISLDFWKPKKGFPMGIRLYDLGNRKQKVLSLLLNLGVKKAVKSSLGNHIVADEKAILNKNQIAQLTEFPEVLLVDTDGGKKSLNNVVTELQRSQVPQDNYNTEERIKQLNYEETSIGPNQLGISPPGQQTLGEVRDNATNSNIRLSLANRVSMIFWKDFWRKWLMMHQKHYPDQAQKLVVISREFGDKYLTFEKKYLEFSGDPHVKIGSKYDIEQKNKQLFANHVVLHTYIEKLSQTPNVPYTVILSLRKALRLLGYTEDEILEYVEEPAEEIEAKSQLNLLNRNQKLEPLSPDQVDERHEIYLHIYKQAQENDATKAAVADRVRLKKIKDKKTMKMTQQQLNANTNGMQNQMTADMISNNRDNQQGGGLSDIQM